VRAPANEIGARSKAYLKALLARDRARATGVVERAVSDGVLIEDIYLDLLQPALYDVGRRWATGEINVAEEHYATAVTQQLLEKLSARMRVPPSDGRLAVVAATPGELHEIGARMVADFLEGDGWEVLPLGASTPALDLAALVDRECPELVALSTATPGSLPAIEEVLSCLQRLETRPLVVVGGQFWMTEASPSAQDLGADLVAHDPSALVALARERVPPHED
jgi:methanogenic corrinoid protein MtbC1